MTVQCPLPRVASALVVLTVIWICQPQVAHAASLKCAATTSSSTPVSPAPGQPCWVDVTPYPFGSDGNPVAPTSDLCLGGAVNIGPNNYGPNWGGDFNPNGNGIQGNPACYERATSMAFRAWNRGLAATAGIGGTSAFGVWLYNGTTWFPDPTFPGSGVCPGNTVLWAGKLDYWLIGSSTAPVVTLCRFDGVNLVWDALTLPAATIAHWPLTPQGTRTGEGITAGTCFAWNNCWFFGNDGVEVHWDGQELTDETGALGSSPWLQGNFVAAAGTVTPNGTPFGLAIGSGQIAVSTGLVAVPTAPDGTAMPEAFGSTGGPWSPLADVVPGNPLGPIPAGTTPVVAAMDASGDTWVAERPVPGVSTTAQATPLMRLSPDGTAYPCSGYGATTFPLQTSPNQSGYTWTSLAVAPDGSASAAGVYSTPTQQFQAETGSTEDVEPVIVQAACGTPPTSTEFRIPDPFDSSQATPSVPADFEGSITAVAAPATNDVWAAAGPGTWTNPNTSRGGNQRPHLYVFTDGQTPDAPAGDDNETRPSLFTLSPPVYQVTSPTVVVTPTTTTTTTTKGKPKKVKLKPAIYDTHTKLQVGGTRAKPTYILHLTFKLRRTVTVGLEALKGKRVVARTPMKRFKGRTGELSVPLSRKAWPTGLKLISPPAKKGASK